MSSWKSLLDQLHYQQVALQPVEMLLKPLFSNTMDA